MSAVRRSERIRNRLDQQAKVNGDKSSEVKQNSAIKTPGRKKSRPCAKRRQSQDKKDFDPRKKAKGAATRTRGAEGDADQDDNAPEETQQIDAGCQTIEADFPKEDSTQNQAGIEAPERFLVADGEEAVYTSGMARMVVIEEAANKVPAILPDSNLSQLMQNAALLDRRLHQFRQLDEIIGQVEDKMRAISGEVRHKLQDLHADRARRPEMESQLRAIEENIDALDRDCDLATQERDASQDQWRATVDPWQVAQGAVASALEALFVDYGLLPAATALENPIAELATRDEEFYFPFADEWEQLQASWEREEGAREGSVYSPPATSENGDIDPGGVRHNLKMGYLMAKNHLHNAQQWLDEWREVHNGGSEVDAAQEARDPDIVALEAKFPNFFKGQRLTRAVKDAEKIMAEAQKAVLDSSWDIQMSEQSSGFRVHEEDGLASGVYVPETMYDLATIETWRESGSEFEPLNAQTYIAETTRVPDHEDWTFREVDWNESVSVVAEGSERRHIDNWTAAAGSIGWSKLDDEAFS